jgi:hypothetical protein
VIYTDDSSGGADDCNEGENYQDVFSALEVLRQPSDYLNVDRYQGREHNLEPAERFLDSVRLRHGVIVRLQNVEPTGARRFRARPGWAPG